MGFTSLRGSGDPLVMDATFFAQALPLQGLGGDHFHLFVSDFGSTIAVGPYATTDPPYAPGVANLPGIASPVLVQAAYGAYSEPDGLHWLVNYYTLEPGSSAEVEELDLYSPTLPGGTVSFSYLPGQASATVHLNDFAPTTATVGTVYDREAANSIEGSDDADLILGFGGDDTVSGDFGADSIDGGTGNDLLSSTAYSVAFSLGDGSVDSLNGGAGNDTLQGDDDADLLLGDIGNDVLKGYAGADTIGGGKGNDTISGGDGADLLTGGAGRDQFVFGNPWMGGKGDKIKDFNPADDQIVIDVNFFDSTYTAGMDLGATGHFVANVKGQATSPVGVSQFVYDTDSGKLYWDQDGAGGKGLLLATFTNLPVLTAADFTVIG